MDGVGVSQQMLVKFEMSVTSGPGGFSVCVCMYIRVCACVRGRAGAGVGGSRRGRGPELGRSGSAGLAGSSSLAPVPAALVLTCRHPWLPSSPPGKELSPFCSTRGSGGLKKHLPQK